MCRRRHANLHTIDNLFWAFGELVRRDGYVVRGTRSAFDQALLAQCGILVIANAQSPVSASSPSQATAFTNEEVVATSRWVRGGGRLLLIADHMPLAAAAANLAAAFDVTFNDGFAVERPAFKAL